MTSKDWFCIALRLFGIWILIQAVQEFVPYLLYTFSSIGAGQGITYWIFMLVWFLIRSTFALVFIIFAPAIATRLYGKDPPPVEASAASATVAPNALKVGMQLLAVYAIILGVQSLAGVVMGILSGESISLDLAVGYGSGQSEYLRSLLTCGLNFVFAAILIIYNERLVTFIQRIRYVADRDAYEPPSLEE